MFPTRVAVRSHRPLASTPSHRSLFNGRQCSDVLLRVQGVVVCLALCAVSCSDAAWSPSHAAFAALTLASTACTRVWGASSSHPPALVPLVLLLQCPLSPALC